MYKCRHCGGTHGCLLMDKRPADSSIHNADVCRIYDCRSAGNMAGNVRCLRLCCTRRDRGSRFFRLSRRHCRIDRRNRRIYHRIYSACARNGCCHKNKAGKPALGVHRHGARTFRMLRLRQCLVLFCLCRKGRGKEPLEHTFVLRFPLSPSGRRKSRAFGYDCQTVQKVYKQIKKAPLRKGAFLFPPPISGGVVFQITLSRCDKNSVNGFELECLACGCFPDHSRDDLFIAVTVKNLHTGNFLIPV